MLRHSMRAMNTDCLLILHVNGVNDERAGRAALMRAAARVQEYERTFSRFQPDSGLSRLNEGPSDRVQVSAELAALLARALEYARLTGGVFDPLVLAELEALGYDRTFEEVSSRGHALHPVAARARTHWTLVQVDAARGVVNRPPGARIDLGGVAKGAAADAAMSELASFPGALIDLGGDIRAHGQPDDADGWIVAVDEPAGPHVTSLDYLKLRDGAVATSSVRRRQWSAQRQDGTSHYRPAHRPAGLLRRGPVHSHRRHRGARRRGGEGGPDPRRRFTVGRWRDEPCSRPSRNGLGHRRRRLPVHGRMEVLCSGAPVASPDLSWS